MVTDSFENKNSEKKKQEEETHCTQYEKEKAALEKERQMKLSIWKL